MGWFKRKSDPLAERARDLTAQIAELEGRIKELSEQPSNGTVPAAPPRRTATTTTTATAPTPAPVPVLRPKPTVAVSAPRRPPASPVPAVKPPDPEMYNAMGVRKFDLAEAIKRFTGWFKTPPPSNPNLVKYLASGGLPGMRAMRYEKRVARNRFILLVIGFTILLWIIVAAFLHGQ
jgi:hypothetical protein